jgi:hypothetical protein
MPAVRLGLGKEQAEGQAGQQEEHARQRHQDIAVGRYGRQLPAARPDCCQTSCHPSASQVLITAAFAATQRAMTSQLPDTIELRQESACRCPIAPRSTK